MTKWLDKLPQLIGFAFAALATLVAIQAWRPAPDTSPTPEALQEALTPANRGVAVNEHLAALSERPIFHVSRRPYEPPKEAEPVVVAPTISLVGIIKDGDTRIGLVVVSNLNRVFRVVAGDKVSDWLVEEITDTELTVSDAQGDQEVLGLPNGN
ncbi:MAG: hypothetical protein AAF679_12710 [Pseudomonadota bacterium]